MPLADHGRVTGGVELEFGLAIDYRNPRAFLHAALGVGHPKPQLLHARRQSRYLRTLGEHWHNVGRKLGSAVDAYNKSVGTLEGRVLASARKFRDLAAVPGDRELPEQQQIEQQVRLLAAAELDAGKDSG